MMDPGALGTFIIGLESVRLDGESNGPARRPSRGVATRQRRTAAVVVARWLRLAADRFDRPAGTGPAGLATG